MNHNIYVRLGEMERITRVVCRHLRRACFGGTNQEVAFAARAKGGGARHVNSGRRALWAEREDKEAEVRVGLGNSPHN